MNISSRQRGVAAVEFGILLIPMITLAFGITEFGRAMYQYNAVAKGVRDAVRYLSQTAAGDATAVAAAKCLVRYGNTACSGNPLAPELAPGKSATITVEDASTDPGHALQQIPGGGGVIGVVNLVTVEVSNYQFTSLVSYVVPNIPFNTISVTMIQSP
jgi:Flp pilus assembly protein TadG